MGYNQLDLYEQISAKEATMRAIRGVFDGETFNALPGEPLPAVEREIPVAIVFLEETPSDDETRQRQLSIAKRMRAAREAMPPLDVTVKDLIEAGRVR